MTSFSGGERLNARLAEISKKLEKSNTLRAGFLESAGYEEGTTLPVATVAAIQEFGAPAANIPPRPFFRPMIAAHSDEWGEIIASRIAADNYDPAITLDVVGELIQSQLTESIEQVDSPALSPITLMLRKMFGNDRSGIRGRDVGEAARRVAAGEEGATGSQAHPLIWTGYMYRRTGHEVV